MPPIKGITHSKQLLKNTKLLWLVETQGGRFMFYSWPVGYSFNLSACWESIENIVYAMSKQLYEMAIEEAEVKFKSRIRIALWFNND